MEDFERRRRFLPLLLHRRSYTTPTVKPLTPVSLRARPFLYLTTFVVLHQSITTLALLPAYSYFRFTDASPAFLAGPYTAFVLRQRVPFLRGDRTVEDVAEVIVQRSVRTGWRVFGKFRGRKVTQSEEDDVAEEVIDGLEGKKRWRDTVAERARGGWERARGWKDARAMRVNSATDENSWSPGGGTLRHAMDIAAAYLVVKAIFPVRLAASFLLTPRFARAFVRRWG